MIEPLPTFHPSPTPPRERLPAHACDHVPDDGALVDLIAEIAPTAAARQALLVDNPQRLYGFPVSVGGLLPAPVASGHSA